MKWNVASVLFIPKVRYFAIHFVVCHFVVVSSLNAQSTESAERLVDSLRYFRNQGNYEKLRPLCLEFLGGEGGKSAYAGEALYYLALTYQIGDAGTGIVKTDSIIRLIERRKKTVHEQWLLQAKALQATYYRRAGRYNESIELGQRVIEEGGDSIATFMAVRNMSITYRHMDRYDSALKYAFEAERLSSLLSDKFRVHQATQNLVNLLSILGKTDEMIEGERRLLKIAKSIGNRSLEIADETNLGESFASINRLDSSIYYLNSAIKKARAFNDQGSLAVALQTLGMVYFNNKEYNKAISTLNLALDAAKAAGQAETIVKSLSYLAAAKFEKREFREAEALAKESLSSARSTEMISYMVGSYDLLAKIDEARGDLKSAIVRLKLKHQLEDSLLNSARVRAIDEIEAKSENDRKNDEIRNLRQQTEIQSLEIQQQRIFLLLFLAVVLLILVVVYYNYRQRLLKAKTNELLVRQKLLRAQINPHFFFNALTSIQSHLLSERNIQSSNDYLVSFSRLMRNTLEFSMEELISLDEELSMVKSYLELRKLSVKYPYDYTIEVDKTLQDEQVLIPPMLTQPFLENAVDHAFVDLNQIGTIKISYTILSERLHIVIEDNGVGFKSANSSNNDHKSRAISITNERISLLKKTLDEEFTFSVEEKSSSPGVIVTFILPLIKLE